ncbi:MAG: glycerol-3-phosphate 1-O-acyltransferase PlsY [Undibacterium sp.]|nr:glycerol-3-phosphate 1-O-acyltransferase PlsY [Opitutaceae bacterium]
MFAVLVVIALLGYLLGSLPFGYVVARAKGVNIFEVGSKNPGATNVRRVLGAGPGNLVFALDALKGALAASWAFGARDSKLNLEFDAPFTVFNGHYVGADWIGFGMAGLVGALLGHSFSCFTKFRGGKGVATAAGGCLVLMPLGTLIAAIVWVVTFYSSRYVSLASILAAIALPITVLVLRQPTPLLIFAFVAALFVVIRHRANITRLMNGSENRFVKKPTPTP